MGTWRGRAHSSSRLWPAAAVVLLGAALSLAAAAPVNTSPAPAAACGIVGGAAPAASAALSFARIDRGDYSSIYVASRDGRRVSRVVPGKGPGDRLEEPAAYFEPAWSPTGRCLAFTAETYPTGSHGYDDVYVLTPARKLVAIGGGDSSISGRPSWAPDGKRLVLVGYQRQAGGGLYIARVGGGTTAITPGGLEMDGPADDSPAWSPDGKAIAFARLDGDRSGLYLIRPDGTGLKRLTTARAGNPSWAPDGRRLVFDTGGRIAVIDRNGGHFRYVTTGAADEDPAWSPDGRAIAFVRKGDVWLTTPTGRGHTLHVRGAFEPAWRPT